MARERPLTYQDLREDSPTFGAIAVKRYDGHPLGDYGVMTIDAGGGGVKEVQLAGWTLTVPVVDVG
ncbi:hypothetical protein H7J86_26395 [Mycobacterium hackensackense]|uniref:hypothetical protein n=1 Tax=Mycobacterium hackensackense TaxID=228909 RepID=UPI002265B9E6|nr:hypothetical protein [Mycobacterium hackensackense]MCV7255700.1 hypothetical protein [Mycobacterium hackensackense]